MKLKMNEKIAEEILERFKKNKIRYCVLRNYEKFEENKDIDILIDFENGGKVKNILKKMGLVKRIGGWGPYLVCDCKADVKIGCIDCDGRFYREANGVLKRIRGYKKIYVLGYEDELEHLIVHSIVTKGNFREDYRRKIEGLIKECNLEVVEKRLVFKFGEIGRKVLKLIIQKNYDGALSYRQKMQKDVRTLMNFIRYYFYRVHFFCKKRVIR